ncbi:MAG: NifU family protein [Actinobacteria bacterium]|jgi:Fe-S cluster biogenesis protein NfuA|nr:NifU family protein [Actinomycetota bacterium]MCL5444754.1 NifU family protein [Actinomycetota bacterium]
MQDANVTGSEKSERLAHEERTVTGGPEALEVEVPPSRQGLSDEEKSERMGSLMSLMDLMRPAVQSDGGDLLLVSADVELGTVEVQLQGACSSCAVSSSTLQGGVERILRDRLPWVTEVIGGVDDSIDPFESAAQGRGAYVPRY